MTSVDQVLKIAKGELGTKESPVDSNVCKYSRWYPMVGPWCAMFVSWVLDKADIEGYKHAFTPAGAELFKSQGRWTQNPRPGDVAYFDFPDSLPRIQHVGFVEKVSGSVVTTIEGNTSSGAAGSQDNGGGVFRRERARSLIVGFGRPPYGKGGDVGDSEKEFKKKNWFSLDDAGADVKLWQRQLNTVMEADLEVSGKFDKQTLEVTKIFQKANALEDDGRVGSKTIRKMEGAYQEIKGGKGDKPPTLELWDEGKWVKRARRKADGTRLQAQARRSRWRVRPHYRRGRRRLQEEARSAFSAGHRSQGMEGATGKAWRARLGVRDSRKIGSCLLRATGRDLFLS